MRADGRSLIYVLCLGFLDNLFLRPLPGTAAPLANLEYEKPTARIIVHVRQKRSKHWDFWQLNSNVCPPSLCFSSDEGGSDGPRRPRGTAGTVFYNGDIVLDPYSEEIILGPEANHHRSKRATIRNRDMMWKDGIMYYLFDDNINPLAKRAARRAMQHISDRSCIQFKKKTKDTEDYVRIISEPGCWSSVGRIGKEQKLSLGRGCERQIGTAIHELLHTLGFWHEHARPDRDDYVQVVYPNISPRYVPDFEPINATLAKSRGFPYDYRSIMHYKDRTFTNNGGKTLRVIGEGKELKITIGQRDGMSNIDIAQLRDMYFCNQKQAKNESICPKGWVKNQGSCYLFVRSPRQQFAGAQKQCQQYNGHLVIVSNTYENTFLNKYIKANYPNIRKWRTGGRRINDTFYWDDGDNLEEFDFTQDWFSFTPKTYSALVFVMNKNTKNLEWKGDWVGSYKQLPKYSYSYICERPSKRKCLKGDHPDGRDYRGTLDHTRDGVTCQNWTYQYPHQHNLINSDVTEEDKDGLGPHNYCRNPKALRRNRPWCFTTKAKEEWQYCDVSICAGSLKKRANTDNNNEIPNSNIPVREDTNSGNNENRETIFVQQQSNNEGLGNGNRDTRELHTSRRRRRRQRNRRRDRNPNRSSVDQMQRDGRRNGRQRRNKKYKTRESTYQRG